MNESSHTGKMMASERHCSSPKEKSNSGDKIYRTNTQRTKGMKYILHQKREKYWHKYGLTPSRKGPSHVQKVIIQNASRINARSSKNSVSKKSNTAHCSNRTSAAASKIRTSNPHQLQEGVLVSKVPDAATDTTHCSNRNSAAASKLRTSNPHQPQEGVLVSKVPNEATEVRSHSLPPAQEGPGAEGRSSSVPVPSQPPFKGKAKCVGMNRYRRLAPQLSASCNGPRKRKRRNRKKKSFPPDVIGPSGESSSHEEHQEKSEWVEEATNIQSPLNLPPSPLASVTGPLTQAIFKDKAYLQQDFRYQNNHFSGEITAIVSPLPDVITLSSDPGDRKTSSSSTSSSSSELLGLRSVTEIPTEVTESQQGRLKTSPEAKLSNSSSSSTNMESSFADVSVASADKGNEKSPLEEDTPSVIEMSDELHKVMKPQVAGVKPSSEGKLSASSGSSTNMEEAAGAELVVYRSCGSAQNGAETIESSALTRYEQSVRFPDYLDHAFSSRNRLMPMKKESSRNMTHEISSCSDVDLLNSGAETKSSVMTQKTHIRRKVTKLSLSQKRKFSLVDYSFEESEETHENSGHTNQSSKRKIYADKEGSISRFFNMVSDAPGIVSEKVDIVCGNQSEEFSDCAASLIPVDKQCETSENPGIPHCTSAQKGKDRSEKVKSLSELSKESDSVRGWVAKTNVGQQLPSSSDEPPSLTSSSNKGQSSSLTSIESTNDSLNLQVKSYFKKRTSHHFLESHSQECLKRIVHVLNHVYGSSEEECLEILSRNQFNLLTSLQELQTVNPDHLSLADVSD